MSLITSYTEIEADEVIGGHCHWSKNFYGKKQQQIICTIMLQTIEYFNKLSK